MSELSRYYKNKDYYTEYQSTNEYKEYQKLYHRDYGKIYYEKNKDKIKKYRKDYMSSDKWKEYQKEYQKEYRNKNKEKIKSYLKKPYLKEYRKQYMRKYYNDGKGKEYMKKYRMTDMGMLSEKNNRHRRRQFIKTTDDKTVTVEFIKNLIILQKGECKGCKEKLIKKGKNNYDIDHIQPLSKGGLHTATNIQLLCKKCNCIKHNKTIEDIFFK